MCVCVCVWVCVCVCVCVHMRTWLCQNKSLMFDTGSDSDTVIDLCINLEGSLNTPEL